jgi:hypothetical protein
MKNKLPSPLTIAWCKKNKKVVQEMNAKFDKKKSPSHWHSKGSKDYWRTKLKAHEIRAAKLNRLPRWADQQAIEQVFRDAPTSATIDHEFPLQGELVSGLHVHSNLRYLPASENASKGNNFNPRCFIINRSSISLI